MAFEKPLILFLFFSLLIPILIHLFNLKKYKTIYFPNIHFLEKIKSKNKKMSKLKRLIILFFRLLLISSLILAFSQPYIPTTKSYEKTFSKTSIYIDNSLSMSIQKDGASIIEKAKEYAIDIITNLESSTKINIITNNQNFKNERFFNKEDALDMVRKIKIAPFKLDICEVVDIQNRITNYDSLINKFIISDFQTSFLRNYINCNTSAKNCNMISIETPTINNLSINSCSFKSPFRKMNQKEELIIEIENHSNQDKNNVQLRLFINDKKRGFLNINIPAKSSIKKTIDFINLEAGNINGKIEIDNDDFKYDNQLFFSYKIKDQIRILSISEKEITPAIQTVFNDKVFKLDIFKKDQINFEKIEEYDLIIIDHLKLIQKGLASFLKQSLSIGKNVLIFPNQKINTESYNYLLKELKADKILNWEQEKTKVSEINFNNLIFENVFKIKEKNINLPTTEGYFNMSSNRQNSKKEILNLLNRNPFFIEYNNYKGKLFFCTSPLDFSVTNFAKHAIFLPMMYNASMNLDGESLYNIITKNINIKCPECSQNFNTYLNKKDEFELIVQTTRKNNNLSLELGNSIKNEGVYNLFFEKNIKKYLSFNFNRNEGKFNNTNLSSFKKIIKNSSNTLKTNNSIQDTEPKQLTFLFIILGIVSFLFETLLLKFWKT